MSLAIVYSRGKQGIQAPLVTVEAYVSNGLPSLSIVGLPEAAVKESKDRVRVAVQKSGFKFPAQRITINLAPADIPKDGGRFDLAIALGILAASGQLNAQALEILETFECVGELSLGGELREVQGVLPVSIEARNAGRQLIVPVSNAEEAALVKSATILPAAHLLDVCAHLNGEKLITPASPAEVIISTKSDVDFSDVHGQFHVKRAFEIAATGAHNLIMMGPPGTGKSMLAARLPTILPPLAEEQALQSAAIASVSSAGFSRNHWRQPPFRAPHHTASAAALVGGGSQPKPGEISLAHHGALFLDELPEFDRHVLEVLREPLETGLISISRAAHQAEFPARFLLIAAMNPCPCGYVGDPSGRCHCSAKQIQRYRARISGPLLDRIDMHIEVPRVPHEVLHKGSPEGEESSEQIRLRVMTAREKALVRQNCPNAALTAVQIKKTCPINEQAYRLLDQAMTKLGLSNRAYHRILKLARTIADLADSSEIETAHISEAISYRRLDRSSI